MRRTLRQVGIMIAVLVVAAFVMFLINQTVALVALADRVHPFVGDAALWSLLALYAFCIGVPTFLLLRLPPPLRPPALQAGPEFDRFRERLAKRLRRNPHLAGRPLASPSLEEIEASLAVLDAEADRITRAAAKQVFLTTAISQNGSLDAVVVLAAQSKLVLEVARVYYQRPTLRDMTYLYGNVAATAFLTSELDDIDLTAQVQPILTSMLGSAAGAIPGLQTATSLVVNSVTTGAANAFLTLRVGVVTRQYCRAVVRPERRGVRRTAVLQATRMLGGIVSEGAGTVTSAVWGASRRGIGGAAAGLGLRVKSAGAAVADRVRPRRRDDPPPTNLDPQEEG